MAMYKYTGRDASGAMIDGKLKSNSVPDVVNYLSAHNITPINIESISEKGDIRNYLKMNVGFVKVNLLEVRNFCHQLATLLNAGVPIIKSINQLAQSTRVAAFSTILSSVADDLTSGQSFAAALRKFPAVFSPLITNIIDVGENTGHLIEVLQQIVSYLDTAITNRRRLLTAVRYPLMVVITICVAMVILNIFVIPKFALMFASFKAELPFATKLIFSVSTYMLNHWIGIAITFVAVIAGIYYIFKIPAVRYFWDHYKLYFPVFGNLQRRILLAQFAWTFSLVLRSGIPIIKGITLAGSASDNEFFRQKVLTMRDNIEHGESFSISAVKSGIFLPTVLQMMEVGEESGRLDDILSEVAKYYESDVDYDLRRLGELIEPLLLGIIAVFVLILALAIYLPMWDLIKVAKF